MPLPGCSPMQHNRAVNPRTPMSIIFVCQFGLENIGFHRHDLLVDAVSRVAWDSPSFDFWSGFQEGFGYDRHIMMRFSMSMGISAMSSLLYQRIYEVVRHIPHGRVATYGQVAMVVGPPMTAQQVGEAMAALRDDHPEPPVA